MTWYRTGTITLTHSSSTVTGEGTAFAANARVGDALCMPSGAVYEVTNIASDAVLSISPAWQGDTVGAQQYAIAPMQGYVKESADALREYIRKQAGIQDAVGETQKSAAAAKGSADVAKGSADVAKASADSAKESDSSAKASANSAKASDSSAKDSAAAAKASSDSAKASENAAKASADAANAAKDNVAGDANAAKDSAAAAKASSDSAKASENAAKTSADAANAAKDSVAGDANAAKDSAAAAKASAESALNSASEAGTRAFEAGTAAAAAQEHADSAKASENAAKGSADAAKAAADGIDTSALLNRANHTGTQPASTITGLAGSIADGAVVETGVNENGSYTRFASGLQICHGFQRITISANSRIYKRVIFPAAFINSMYSVGCAIHPDTLNFTTWGVITLYETSTSADIYAGTNGPSSQGFNFNWIAIGEWK